MAHIIGNQCDGQYVQVKIHHELNRLPQLIVPVVQRQHVNHNIDKWFTMVLLGPAR